MLNGMSDIPLPPEKWRYPRGDFEAGGKRVFEQLVDFGGLKTTDAVVDAGCGPGRVARHLADYLDPEEGSYDGFDVVERAVNWSRQYITSEYPNFRFELAEVQNEKYAGRGGKASEYRWPYPSGSKDYVFAASLMTHLLPEDHANYVRETARVLKPGGRCWISYFLLNRTSRARIKNGRASSEFSYRRGRGCRIARKDSPAAVAYDENLVRKLFEKNGLTIIGVRYGWCRYTADHHQDAIVAAKD